MERDSVGSSLRRRGTASILDVTIAHFTLGVEPTGHAFSLYSQKSGPAARRRIVTTGPDSEGKLQYTLGGGPGASPILRTLVRRPYRPGVAQEYRGPGG